MKLEDIDKQNIHKVPDKYFEDLPLKIQSRIAEESRPKTWVVTYGLRYALPAILLLAITVYVIIKPSSTDNPEQLLAQVSTEELITYLESSDITTEELVESLELSDFELEFYENETGIVNELEITDDELDALIDDFETEDIL